MVGNSLKSDVLPVLTVGGHGFHIPYHITWAHERVEPITDHENFKQVSAIQRITQLHVICPTGCLI
ncbi:MAG: hypothetical protein U5K54_00765 [Cytophagales bacterium]|nr:hypothetical protein [Cytophagales bacterium]